MIDSASFHTHPLARGEPPHWSSGWGDDVRGPWVSFEVDNVEYRLRWMPPGTFWMGSPETESGRSADEGPRHLVTLSRGFWIGEVPCTQALWYAVTGARPSAFPGDDRPVEQVSWEDVHMFLGRLSERCPELEPRLPSEAEWEYACRAGTQTATYAGDLRLREENDAAVLDDVAWYAGNSSVGLVLYPDVDSSVPPTVRRRRIRPATRRVGAKQPNEWGLCDMLGHVWEWCSDGPRMYSMDAATDPMGSVASDADRAVRGGACRSDARFIRAAKRSARDPSYHDEYLGFRLARGP